jgi:hypothetical protein
MSFERERKQGAQVQRCGIDSEIPDLLADVGSHLQTDPHDKAEDIYFGSSES